MAEEFKPETRRINVSAKCLAMMEPFHSREEARYYLSGVFITPHEEKGVYLVATDGHRMAIVYDESGETNGDWICAVSEHLFSVARSPVGERVYLLGADYGCVTSAHVDDPMAFGRNHMAADRAEAIDGTFPDWRRIIPNPDEPENPMCFNAGYLADFKKASEVGGGNGMVKIFGGKGGVLVRLQDVPEFLGIQMPIRDAVNALNMRPDWLFPTIQAAE